MTALEKYAEARTRVTEAMNAARAVAKEAFADCSKEFFASSPEVGAIVWEQYTPYFNDGEECVFSVGDVELRAVGDDLDDDDYEERTRWSNKYYAEKSANYKAVPDSAYDLAEKLMGVFSEDDLKEMFGDHARIIVTRAGVDVEHYEHD